ncbi:MAG TPA: cytochrome c [Terriglobales bacterium]|nr:cytochrome c [Terriglobales bacterium]
MHLRIGVVLRTIAVTGLALGLLMFAGLASAQSNGEKTYKAKCAGCHGPNGDASTPAAKAMKARDFCSDEVKKETDAEWSDIITKGKNKMPAFGGKISDADIKDVIAYIRSLCKK